MNNENEYLEFLLIGCLFSSETNKDFLVSTFKSVFKLLEQGLDIFEKIPEKIYVSNDYFKEIETNSGSFVGLAKDLVDKSLSKYKPEIDYFENDGVLIYDGIHGSAFGLMSYIYRSKGIRIYYLRSGDLIALSSYSTIDHNGFQLWQERIDSLTIEGIKSISEIISFLNYSKDLETESNMSKHFQRLLYWVTNINQRFEKHYFIEYLLFPPDITKLSQFSQRLRDNLWNLVLSKIYKDNWGIDVQNQSISFLSNIGLSPTYESIHKFLSEEKTSEEILERLDRLEINMTNTIEKQDLIEFKPNFNGIGINGNEAFKRLEKFYIKYFC